MDPSLPRVCLPSGAAGPLPQGTTDSNVAKPDPPAPVHLVDLPRLICSWPDPIKAAPQAWQCASSPDRGHTTPQWVLPLGEGKIRYTSLTVAPAVGWGQTSRLTAVCPPTQVTPDSTGEVPPQFHATQGTIQDDETEEFSSKETPESSDS